jgi:hypothetical protein
MLLVERGVRTRNNAQNFNHRKEQSMTDVVFENLINAFPERWQEEIKEIVAHWHDEGKCARAEIMGIADRKENRKYRDAIYKALEDCPPDGFTVQYAQAFGLTMEQANADVNGAIGEARKW